MLAVPHLEANQIYQNLYAALTFSDSTVQLWISLTFAVIVAVHLGADKIGRKTFKLIAFLYGLYSVVAVIRYVADSYQILYYQKLLRNLEYAPWPVPDIFGFLIGLRTLSLILVSSVGTLGFVRSSMKAAPVSGS
jgi:hypothetical protein